MGFAGELVVPGTKDPVMPSGHGIDLRSSYSSGVI